MKANCPYQDQCSGCDLLHLNSSDQSAKKLDAFKQDFDFKDVTIQYQRFGDQALRSRLDFVISNGKIGLYQKGSRELVDIESCLQLEPALQEFYSAFRKISWPINKGSVRLRVGPQGQRGAWLDFANEDIKKLIDEETSLLQLQALAFVEIGQRHKTLIRKPTGPLGLGDSQFHPWFQTWMKDQAIPLVSTVASFTQPSHVANKGITQKISEWFLDLKPHQVLEFGSGIGNLTFPALTSMNTHVTATDIDVRALEALKINLEKSGLLNRVTIQAGDFRIKKPQIKDVDVLLLNPARSGVGDFLGLLLPYKPQAIIYMSCFPESFFKDTQLLRQEYSPQEVILMDQFPNTKHVEVLTLFRRREESI